MASKVRPSAERDGPKPFRYRRGGSGGGGRPGDTDGLPQLLRQTIGGAIRKVRTVSSRTHQQVTPAQGDRPTQDRGRSSLRTEQRSDQVKLRRALSFFVMTLILPGSAQLAAGNKKVGRVALRIWAGLWIAVVVFALLALVSRGTAVSIITFPATLRIVQVLVIVLGVGWIGLFVDAWRISRPPELARGHRLGFGILNLALVFLLTGGMVASATMISAQHDLMASVFAGGGDSHAKNGRINVLLMGGDAGSDRVGLRPDSMTVASIDADTGRTVLLSLPRNMEKVPFPTSSPLHKVFPKGYFCSDHSCMLNAVYTYAMAHTSLYPGVKDPGAQATMEAAEGVTGLSINYYALIDLKGFQTLINAVGGITVTVNTRLPIGGQTPGAKVKEYIEPGRHHLDGFHALWFARSRHADSDYARMERQKCVMNAMLNQLDPVTVVTKFNQIASAGKQIMATDIPTSEINTLMELALKARKKPITSVAFVPPSIWPGNPDFAKMHRLVAAKIAAAEAANAPKSTSSPTAAGTPSAKSSSATQKTKKAKTGTAENTDNLAAVCSA